MNIDNLWNSIHQEDGLSRTLGMEFISTPEDDTLKARMAVDDRNKQPFGLPRTLPASVPWLYVPGRWLWASTSTATT